MTRPTDIPDHPPASVNRQVQLIRRPEAIPQADDFALAETPVPEPGDGQFRVRNIYLSADPAQRGWASAEANYSQPVPLGGVMRALAVGVVEASRCAEVQEGEYLYGWFGWQDYAVAGPEAIVVRARLPLPLAQFAGLTGINGLSAYLGLTRLGRPEAGDTLLVTTAAGAVGSLVGQIGKRLGCRTIGLTGDDAKVARCLSDYGYDAAFNYRETDLATALTEAAPDGINVFFDNVGGEMLDTGLRHMAIGGRVVQCGTASIPVWTPAPIGPRNEREVLTRRLVWSGFLIFDYMDQLDEAAAELARWHEAGDTRLDLDIRHGIEQARGAIADLYAGRNTGKLLIRIV